MLYEQLIVNTKILRKSLATLWPTGRPAQDSIDSDSSLFHFDSLLHEFLQANKGIEAFFTYH